MIFKTINIKTYLTVPLMITITKRGIKKVGEKTMEHAPKVLEALENPAVNAGANTAVNSTNASETTPQPTSVPPSLVTPPAKNDPSPSLQKPFKLAPCIETGQIISHDPNHPSNKNTQGQQTVPSLKKIQESFKDGSWSVMGPSYSTEGSDKSKELPQAAQTTSNTFTEVKIPTPPLPMSTKPTFDKSPEYITKETLENAAKTLKPPKPLKPLIPENTLIPDVSNETPETVSKIVSELAIKLSQQDVRKEMLDRKLMTKDDAMPIEVMTETGEIIVIGYLGQGTVYKLTGFGYGHFMKANAPLYMENIFNFKEKFDFYVAVIKQKKDIFQSAAEDKHMLAVFRKSDQTWFSPGYLTSQPTPTKLGGMQFKVYQEINYRNLVPNNPNKPQYFALYKNAKKNASDQIILLKGGADYIESLKQTEAITVLCENLMEKAYVNHNPEGITLDQCIATCMHYDTVVKKNLSHPPTYADILNSTQRAAKVAATKNKIKLVKNEDISE